MTNKNALVTGGNAGIGFATAKALAQKGAHVYIVARDKTKAEEAVKNIITDTGNKNVDYFLADFSSQTSIRKVVSEIKSRVNVIDVLINNAGGTFLEFGLTEDGIEKTIATNHFAYFLLTNLLLEQIKKSAQGRIVNVASGSHYRGKINFESFAQNKGYFVMKAYGQSKLANVLFTNELAERLSGTNVTVNSLHPGFVKTKIGNKNATWYSGLFWSIVTLGAISVEEGAQTSVYLATSPDVKHITGKYFDKCKPKQPSKLALDKNLGKELWKKSEELCPLN